jgi:hypothetical protein
MTTQTPQNLKISHQLENISEQVSQYIENLTWNGLNFVTEENIKQLEFFLQLTSEVRAFRLATSLRYLHVELKRFMTHNNSFNEDRYIFFVSNCWLLSKGILSTEKIQANSRMFLELMGDSSQTLETFNIIHLRAMGIEKVYLEGTMFGFIFYFISLKGKTKGQIFKWNLMQAPTGKIEPELLLSLSIPKSKPSASMDTLLYKNIEIHKLPYDKNENTIRLIQQEKNEMEILFEEDPKNLGSITKEEDAFPLEYLDTFQKKADDILDLIKEMEQTTPFDMPTISLGTITLKNVHIRKCSNEKEPSSKNTMFIFEINHEMKFPVSIRIKDREIYQTLIANLTEYMKEKTEINFMFGNLVLERGNLSIFPLSIFDESKIKFPTLLKDRAFNSPRLFEKVYNK